MCACSSQTRALIVTLLCRMLSTQSKLMCAVLLVNVTNLHVHTQLQTSQVPTVYLKQRQVITVLKPSLVELHACTVQSHGVDC